MTTRGLFNCDTAFLFRRPPFRFLRYVKEDDDE
jgi:hypothetical protein